MRILWRTTSSSRDLHLHLQMRLAGGCKAYYTSEGSPGLLMNQSLTASATTNHVKIPQFEIVKICKESELP